MRARYAEVAVGPDGRPIPDVQVDVYNTGTTTPISETIYAAASGGTTLTNPFTGNDQGEIEFYLEEPARVDLRWSKDGYEAETHAADVMAAGHAHNGTYERVYPVTAFTSTAIQAAIDACTAAGGGKVICPPGTYTISATVQMKSKVVVEGDNVWNVRGFLAGPSGLPTYHSVVWQLADNVNADIVQFATTCIGAALRGVTLSGNKTAQSSGHGVKFVDDGTERRNGNRLQGVVVAQAKEKGIYVELNQQEVRLHDVLVMESGGDGITVEAEDCQLRFVLSGYNAGNGIVFESGSYACQLLDADVFNNTLAGVVVKTPLSLRTNNVQSNNNGREGLVISDAAHTSYNGWVLGSNGQEFATSAIRYAAVRMHHTTDGNDGIAFIGCVFNGGGLESYGIESTEPAPKAASLIGCQFTGTFVTGQTELTVYNVYGGTRVQDKIRPRSAGSAGLVIEGVGSQTGDLLDVRTDSATHILRVGPGAGTPGAGTLGFYNVTPAAQPASADQLRAALQALGLLPSGGSNPLNVLDADVLTNLSGYLIADPNALTTGESTIMREQATTNSLAMANQTLNLCYFTARKTETIASIRTIQGAVAAGATPTLIRWGVWAVDANGALTSLLASTANDTTLLAGSSGAQVTKAFSASWSKVRGTRYAVGLLVVTGATAPQVVGEGGGSMSTEKGVAPRLSAQVTGQADLPSTVASGSLVGVSSRPYFVLLP